MKQFTDALSSDFPNSIIPDDYNYWGTLIGAWDFDWIGFPGTNKERRAKGEWIFSWVLNGTAIQDIFIVPSREENKKNPQQDAEYGTTLRFYNPTSHTWSIFYGSTVASVSLTAERVGDELVLTENVRGEMKWVFSEINDNSFHWKHLKTKDGGDTWYTHIEVYAWRKTSI